MLLRKDEAIRTALKEMRRGGVDPGGGASGVAGQDAAAEAVVESILEPSHARA
jgi:hypothetical protein